jgi:DNA-binding MarR family transcriptional regulator
MSSGTKEDRGPLLGSLLRIASQAMAERHVRWLAESEFSDIQPAHSAVVQPLWDAPDGARLTDLARASRITKQSMSALVDHLEKQGYVQRVPDPADARASLIRLTARGRAFGRAVRSLARSVESEWTERIGARKVGELREALEALRASLLESKS